MPSRFPYQWYPRGDATRSGSSAERTVVKDNKTKRPILTATLIKGETKLPMDALVDSGSDKTLSFAQFGTLMGIDFLDDKFRKDMETRTGKEFEQNVYGLGKIPIPAFYTLMDIEVNGKCQTTRIYWIREKFDPDTDFGIILGQDSIFYTFDIHFSKRQDIFFLSEEKFNPP